MVIMGGLKMKDNYGYKYDEHKSRWDLLPWKQIKKVVDVLTFGAQKYGSYNWQKVNNHRSRYFAAAIRHMTVWYNGEKHDPETKISHLAHAMCCMLFLMWFDDKDLSQYYSDTYVINECIDGEYNEFKHPVT